jgi:hypothetical protein
MDFETLALWYPELDATRASRLHSDWMILTRLWGR